LPYFKLLGYKYSIGDMLHQTKIYVTYTRDIYLRDAKRQILHGTLENPPLCEGEQIRENVYKNCQAFRRERCRDEQEIKKITSFLAQKLKV